VPASNNRHPTQEIPFFYRLLRAVVRVLLSMLSKLTVIGKDNLPSSGPCILVTTTFVRRGEVDRKALRKCLSILDAGGILGMSPEGTRSKTGALQRAKSGVAYFVQKTGAPLLPIAIWGTEKVVSGWKSFRRQEVHICIGELFSLPSPEKRLRSKDLQILADQIMLRIAELLPEEYRGAYAHQ